MNATHKLIYIIFVAGIFLLSACQQEEIGGPTGVKIAFRAVSPLKSAADSIMLTEAYIGVGNIDLKRTGEADTTNLEKIVYEGPYVVDLLNETISPAIRWIFAEPGSYRRIVIDTHNALSGGKSIVVKGKILPAGGSEQIPFELITARDFTFNIENKAGIEVRAGEIVDLLVVFNLAELFRGIDINSLDRNENGILVISEENGINRVGMLIDSFEALSSFGINDGNFPGGSFQDDRSEDAPGEGENTGSEDEGSTPGEEDDDNQDEGSGGADNSDDNGDGGDAGNEDSGTGSGGTEGGENDEPDGQDDNDDAAGEDNPDDDSNDNGEGEDGNADNPDENTGADGGQDDDADDQGGNGDEDADNDDDDRDDDGNDEDDDRDDDGDGADDNNDDDDNRDDKGDDNDDDRDDDDDQEDDDDKKNDDNNGKGKGNSDKGNNGNRGGGKKG